ncbi:MAG TPA: arginine repressor [Chlamydiales bacterium]|nr:arginine repressor [Chlamydiales bacterium]
MAKKEKSSLLDALRQLLMAKKASSQEAISSTLAKYGYEVNQTKVSRLLREIGAVKMKNAQGQVVYSLAKEPAPLSMDSQIRNLILEISSNEVLVVILTSPGAASMVARVIDYNQIETDVLGTIAGDDTIFVAPKSVGDTPKLLTEIKKLLLYP